MKKSPVPLMLVSILCSLSGCGSGSTPPPAPATHFSVDAVPTATVGAAFSFVVTALDGSNNTVNSYTGTVHFTSSDGNAVLPKNSRLRNGVGNFSATLETSGSQTISATDTLTASITGTAIAVLVSGPATHFVVTSPTNATAGMAFSFTVSARDALNNGASGYTGTVHFTSTDGQAVLPANSILSIGEGFANFSVTLNTAGSETITATDTVTPAITGTSNSIGVAVSRFKSAGDMETPRVLHTATLLSNAKVLIAGGVSTLAPPFAPLDTAELFDPTSASFAPTGTMTTARVGDTATLLGNGKVLIAGGNAGDSATAELYDPSTGMFTLTGSMTTARESHTATLLKNGTVLIAGGSDMGDALATAELYDPATGMFTLTGSMTTARESHTATLLSDGKVLIAGGFGKAGDIVTAELYDPSTGMFTLTGNLTSVQRFHTATLLNDGTVLVTGGEYSTGTFPHTCKPLTFSSASAELYDPTNGTFTYTGNMAAQRVSPTATLLTNGEVLVTGGNQWILVPGGPLPPDNCPSTRSLVVASAELFH